MCKEEHFEVNHEESLVKVFLSRFLKQHNKYLNINHFLCFYQYKFRRRA